MKYINKASYIIAFILLVLLTNNECAFSDINYSSIKIVYTINNNGNYTENYFSKGIINKNSELIQFNVNELGKLTQHTLTYKNQLDKNIKIDSKKLIVTKPLEYNFKSGITTYSHSINFDKYNNKAIVFNQSYSILHTLIQELTALNFENGIDTDTFEYNIVLPKNKSIALNNNDIKNVENLVIDSIIEQNSNTYIFKVYNLKYKTTMIKFEPNEVPDFAHPIVRFTINDKTNNIADSTLFANWYTQLCNINDYNINQLKLISEKILIDVKQDSIPKYLFDYVKKNVKYVAIENGINAFKPRDPVSILNNKKGDCKDMALLLYHLLRINGYEAHLALVGTNTHLFNDAYPNLTSFNHAICLLKINNSYIPLDATDNICPYYKTSRHTQNSIAFIATENGKKIKLKNNDNEYSKIIFNIEFEELQDKLDGKFQYLFKGFNGLELKNTFSNLEKKDSAYFIEQYLSSLSNSLHHYEYNISYDDEITIIKGKCSINPEIIYVSSNKIYIDNKFLPVNIKNTKPLKEYKKIIYENGLNTECNFKLKLNNNIKLINPINIKYNNKDIDYHMSSFVKNNKILYINYNYKINHVVINNELTKYYNEFLLKFKDQVNYVHCIE